MNDLPSISISDLFECHVPYLKDLFSNHTYPWELLPLINKLAESLIKNLPEKFHKVSDEVIAGENVTIASTAILQGPAIIGANTEIRPGAYIRGNVITGESCIIGNSTELKNCILLDFVQVPHYNYIGDSILGNHSHMGASAICSNLKSDGSNVTVRRRNDNFSIETGLRKFGAIIGDHSEIGCGSVLNPGTIIGKSTSVYPLVPVRGIIPGNSIVKSSEVIVVRQKEK